MSHEIRGIDQGRTWIRVRIITDCGTLITPVLYPTCHSGHSCPHEQAETRVLYLECAECDDGHGDEERPAELDIDLGPGEGGALLGLTVILLGLKHPTAAAIVKTRECGR